MKTFLEFLKIILTSIGLGIVGIVGFTAWLWLPGIVCCIPETSLAIRILSIVVGVAILMATQFFVTTKFESLYSN